MVLGDRVAAVPDVERDPRTDRAVDAVAEGADLDREDGRSVCTAVPLNRALNNARQELAGASDGSRARQTHERDNADSGLMNGRKVGEIESFAADLDEHVVRIAVQRGSHELLSRVDVLLGTLRKAGQQPTVAIKRRCVRSGCP